VHGLFEPELRAGIDLRRLDTQSDGSEKRVRLLVDDFYGRADAKGRSIQIMVVSRNVTSSPNSSASVA
jgi:hypothetical protein